MRKLFEELFYVPKYGKVREKVMLIHVTMSVAIIVMCLAAMSLSAYAFFSYNVTSGSNMIKAANFETQVDVQITDTAGNAVEDSQITPITSDHKNFRVEGLEVGKWYCVTIRPTDRSTAQTGFIIVTAEGCDVTYHTQQLGVDEGVPGGKTEAVTFRLMVTDATNVFFKAHWGTSSFYPDYRIEGVNEERYITQNEDIKMIIQNTNEGDDNNTGDQDTSGTAPTDTTTSVESATPSEQTDPPEAAETSEPTTMTELSSATEPSAPANTTEPAASESAETTAATEETTAATEETTAATEETTGALATEASEYNGE